MNALTVQTLARVEVWTAPECAGGTRLHVVRDDAEVASSVTLDGDARLTIKVPLGGPDAAQLTDRRVVRVIGAATAEVDEWRILSASTRLAASTVTVIAVPIGTDLANGTLVGTTDADGVRSYDFEGVGLTVAQHLTTYVLPALAEIGVEWVALGLIEPTGPVDVVYHGDSPWGAARKIAGVAQCELRLRRAGATGYALDVLRQVGEDADVVDVREAKNLADLTREQSSAAQYTRMFAFGAALDGVRATMARAVWVVTQVDGLDVSLADPNGGGGPIGFDGQLAPNTAAPDGLAIGGAYLRTAAGTLTAITGSSALAQTVTVASASGITVGDLVQFRADAAGNDLAWLDHPAQVAASGIKIGTVDASEVAGTHNRVPNPAARDWAEADTLPTGWTALGAATPTRNTSIVYTQVGGQSVRATGAADGDGVAFPLAPLTPTSAAPYTSGYVSLWPVSGSVRVELVLIAADATEYRYPVAPAVASNSVLGQWESLGVSGLNALALPDGKGAAVAARLQVVQQGATAAEWYVDAGQVTDGASHAALIEGSGGTRLWQIANAELAVSGAPPDTLTVPLVALARVDAARWGMEAGVVLGGTLRVVSGRAGVATRIRVVGIDRTYRPTLEEKVTLAAVRPSSVLDTFSRGTAPTVIAPAPAVTSGPGGGGGGAGGGGVAVDTQAVLTGEPVVLTAVPAARTALPGNRRVWQNASAFDRVRILADVPDAATAPALKLSAWWSADGGTTKRPMAAAASTDAIDGAIPTAELALDAAGPLRGAMLTLGRACVGDVLCGVDTIGGDEAGGVTLGNVHLQWLRALPDGYRPPPVVVEAESCEVLAMGYWREDWTGYADDAALDAASAAELQPGKFLYGLSYKPSFGPIERGAFLDPIVTFCGHQTFRGHNGPATEPLQGWSIFTYFGEFDGTFPWVPPAFTDVWTRNTWKFPTPTYENVYFDLMMHTFEGDGMSENMLFRLDGGSIKAEHFSRQDALGSVSEILGAASEIVTGDWVDVVSRARITGGNMVMDFWWAPHGSTPVHKGTVTRPAYPGATKVIGASLGTQISIPGGADYWNGRSELIDGAAHPDPFGLAGAAPPAPVSDNRNINMLEDPDFDGPPYATYGWKTRFGAGGSVAYGQSAGPPGMNTRAALVTGSDKWPEQRPLGGIAGQWYTVSAYVQILAGRARLEIPNGHRDGAFYWDSEPEWAGDGQWHRLRFAFAWTGRTALEPRPVITVRGLSSGTSFYVAAAQLEPGSVATAWSRT